MRRTAALVASVVLASTVGFTGHPLASAQGPATERAGAPATKAKKATKPALREVMFVGNNWAGTATVVDARTYKRLKTINIVPDKEAELAAIRQEPDRLALYVLIQQGVGQGNDQYVDDMFTTADGRLVAVSRPSFGDVVWIDLASGKIVAEQQMDGYRTDHMEVSPNGRRLLVSDSTAKSVHEYVLGGKGNPRTGKRLRTFPSGETPHESSYSKDGARIFHASIGRVYTPGDAGELGPVGDVIKADRWFQVVRNSDFKILRRWDMGKELDEAGYPDMSSAVRPMAVAPGERFIYLQVSFFHGIVEFDTQARDLNRQVDYTLGGVKEPTVGRVTRLIPLPMSEEVKSMPREQYVLDSAHHGLAINKRGTKLCVAGTMSDYGAIVGRRTDRRKFFTTQGEKPYWATTSPFSNTCWMSMSGTDNVLVFDYATEKVVATVKVGDHPQRVREGHVPERLVARWRS